MEKPPERSSGRLCLVHFENVANLRKIVVELVVEGPTVYAVVLFARNNVEMQVEHTLFGVLTGCVKNVYATKTTVVYVVICHLLHRFHNLCKHNGVAIENVCVVSFGNYQRVTVGIARNIQKCVGVVVFVDFVRRTLACYDFAKNTVIHSEPPIKNFGLI